MLEKSGLYIIRCRPTDAYYLGATKRSFLVRFREHRTSLACGNCSIPLLQEACTIHGLEALEFIPLKAFPPEEVAEREREALKLLKPTLNQDHVRSRTRYERWDRVDIAGKSYTVEEAAREFHVIPQTIRARIRRGVIGLALVAPPYKTPVKARKPYERRK